MAYVDDSGTEGLDFVLAGYVAPTTEWLKIEGPWRETLKTAGLSEFKTHDAFGGEGEFDGGDRIKLLESFAALIKSANLAAFAVSIDVVAYDKLYRQLKSVLSNEIHQYYHAYLKTFEMELQFIASFAAETFAGVERVNFVFDQQDGFAGRAVNLFNKTKTENLGFAHRQLLGDAVFGDSKSMVPIQAADMFAYVVHRVFQRGRPSPDTELPLWMAALIQHSHIARLDEAAIRDWVEIYPNS